MDVDVDTEHPLQLKEGEVESDAGYVEQLLIERRKREQEEREEYILEEEEQKEQVSTQTTQTLPRPRLILPQEQRTCGEKLKQNRRQLISVSVLLCLACIIGTCAGVYYLWPAPEIQPRTFSPYIPPQQPQFAQEAIAVANSFSFHLKVDDWQHRDWEMYYLLQDLNGYLDTSIQASDGIESVWKEYEVLSSSEDSCSSPYKFTVRDFVDGWWEGNSYLEAQFDSNSVDVCGLPLWPARNYAVNSSLQLCEIDERPTSSIQSRETRVYFEDQHPQLEYCLDILEVYPWAIVNTTQANSVNLGPPTIWWMMGYGGYLHFNTTNIKYEMGVTLRYISQADAVVSINAIPLEGEWSFRVFNENEGFGQKNPIAYETVYHAYSQLFRKYGDPKE